MRLNSFRTFMIKSLLLSFCIIMTTTETFAAGTGDAAPKAALGCSYSIFSPAGIPVLITPQTGRGWEYDELEMKIQSYIIETLKSKGYYLAPPSQAPDIRLMYALYHSNGKPYIGGVKLTSECQPNGYGLRQDAGYPCDWNYGPDSKALIRMTDIKTGENVQVSGRSNWNLECPLLASVEHCRLVRIYNAFKKLSNCPYQKP